MNPTQIVAEALLVVSILDGSMKHASVRRCLRAALSAMDEAQAKGTPLLDGTSRTELTSETAERIQRDDLEMPLARLPETDRRLARERVRDARDRERRLDARRRDDEGRLPPAAQ